MRVVYNKVKERFVLEVLPPQGLVTLIPIQREGIHEWYPFNANFGYKYSKDKATIYLARFEKSYRKNWYDINISGKPRSIERREGRFYHPKVAERNNYIIHKAESLGIVPITKAFKKQDIEEGFKIICSELQLIQDTLYTRMLADCSTSCTSSDIIKFEGLIYLHATEEESDWMEELGEMYIMLRLMTKLVEGE